MTTTIQRDSIDWSACGDLTRHHGRTFYFASQFLPRSTRRSIHAAYAFCRIADDIVDHSHELGDSRARNNLDLWEKELVQPLHPVAVAFHAVRRAYAIPDQPVFDLFSGLRMDLDARTYDTWTDLEHYCYCVAGTIGLISAPIFGCKDSNSLPGAIALGTAMQLTNILRDVAEDASVGRIYLPLEELRRFGVDPDSLLAFKPNGAFNDLIASEIMRARGWYAVGLKSIRALDPAGRLATTASAHLYSKILDRIESAGFDLFNERAAISTAGKVRELPTVAAIYLRMSMVRQVRL